MLGIPRNEVVVACQKGEEKVNKKKRKKNKRKRYVLELTDQERERRGEQE